MQKYLLILSTVVLVFAAPCRASSITFSGVTTIDPGQSQVHENQTVVVVDGYIQDIGDSTQLAVPDGSKVIDASGQFLIPGLADMHVHLEHFDSPDVLGLFVAHGITLVRQMDGRPHILDKITEDSRQESKIRQAQTYLAYFEVGWCEPAQTLEKVVP